MVQDHAIFVVFHNKFNGPLVVVAQSYHVLVAVMLLQELEWVLVVEKLPLQSAVSEVQHTSIVAHAHHAQKLQLDRKSVV